MTIADGFAIIISVIALGFSLFQFFFERKRARDEATINAFAELQKEVLNDERFINADVQHILQKHKEMKTDNVDDDWEKISECLARIEQFAVGVNTKVYNISVLDRMAGSHIIKEYNRFVPIIKYKREKGKTNKRYIEFENMVNKLKDLNSKYKHKIAMPYLFFHKQP